MAPGSEVKIVEFGRLHYFAEIADGESGGGSGDGDGSGGDGSGDGSGEDGESTPALALRLDFAVGTPVADATTTATAEGLQPGTDWTLTMFSTPRVIGSGVVPLDGLVSQLVRIPADTPAGAHRLLLEGTAPDGRTLTAQAWFTIDADGIIRAISLVGPTPGLDELAHTGAEGAPALGLVGGLFLLAGATAVLLARRHGRAA